ncbi:MAG: serine protease, partial [Proteobacteria bacterium]|nr:serine protease [Pseudomonadota bacterium]
MKFDVRFMSIVCAINFNLAGFASDQKFDGVVKVYSRHCERPDKDYRGSGVLFRLDNRSKETFVLTSEHVLLQGRKNQGLCQSVSVADRVTGIFKPYDAELLASDWQSGLAILKVNMGADEIDALAITDLLSEQSPIGTDALFVSGYPYADQEESMSTRGSLDRQKSLRHLMPNANEVLEIRGALGEFGMSGGPVFDGNGKMAGLLSHQFLVERNGPTAVGTFSDQTDGGESHLLALRAADIKSWVQAAITSDFKPGFV